MLTDNDTDDVALYEARELQIANGGPGNGVSLRSKFPSTLINPWLFN